MAQNDISGFYVWRGNESDMAELSIESSKELRNGTLGSAIFSLCQTYRYVLNRNLSDQPGRALWIMLNPSTATEDVQDPTVAKCCGYTAREGLGKATVCNLFALRSTDPKGLKIHKNPAGIGLENDRYIVTEAQQSDIVVCAWGRHGDYLDRGTYVAKLLILNGLKDKLRYLKLLNDGTPGHPLYLPNKLKPTRWESAHEYASRHGHGT